MVWKKRSYSRKTYRRKRAYKKRYAQKKRAQKQYLAKNPWKNRTENQVVRVTARTYRDITTINSGASGLIQIHMYWGARSTGASSIGDNQSAGINCFFYDTVGQTELADYRLHYSEARIIGMKYSFIPSLIQPTGGPTTNIINNCITWVREIDTPDTAGPTSTTIEAQSAINPLVKNHTPGRRFRGYKDSANYIASASGYDKYAFWPSGGSTFGTQNDAGATTILIRYENFYVSSKVGLLCIDYIWEFRGRTI